MTEPNHPDDVPHPTGTAATAEAGVEPEPAGDQVWARAQALQRAYFHQMTLENTPAAFTDDRYTYDDDVWMSEHNRSDDLDRELRGHIRAHPDQFADTEFEDYLRDIDLDVDPETRREPSHHDRPDLSEDELDAPF